MLPALESAEQNFFHPNTNVWAISRAQDLLFIDSHVYSSDTGFLIYLKPEVRLPRF